MKYKLDEFMAGYTEAILWAETDDEGGPLDARFTFDSFSDEAMQRIIVDCAGFQAKYQHEFIGREREAGIDFWLTRQGHGCGFWDGDWPDDVGERLTSACDEVGSVDVYVGDDGRLHICGGEQGCSGS